MLFAVGAWAMYHLRVHIQDRVEIWLDPFAPQLVEHSGYQIAQSLFAQADGGLFGTGFGAGAAVGRRHVAAAGAPTPTSSTR